MGEGLAAQQFREQQRMQEASRTAREMPIRTYQASGLTKSLVSPLQEEIRAIRGSAQDDGRRLSEAERRRIKEIEAQIRWSRSNPSAALLLANVDEVLRRQGVSCSCRAQLTEELRQRLLNGG